MYQFNFKEEAKNPELSEFKTRRNFFESITASNEDISKLNRSITKSIKKSSNPTPRLSYAGVGSKSTCSIPNIEKYEFSQEGIPNVRVRNKASDPVNRLSCVLADRERSISIPDVCKDDYAKRRFSFAQNTNQHANIFNRFSFAGVDDIGGNSILDTFKRPNDSVDLQRIKRSVFDSKTKPNSSNSTPLDPSVQKRHVTSQIENNDNTSSFKRNMSVQIKNQQKHTLTHHNSALDIRIGNSSNSSAFSQNDLMEYPRPLSKLQTRSMASLFEENSENCMIVEYKIDWRAIYEKISKCILNGAEMELINYFSNSNLNLEIFSTKCLHRYLTFGDVSKLVFNNILPADHELDLRDELLSYQTQLMDIACNLNSTEIERIIKYNVKKIKNLQDDYLERQAHLKDKLETFKTALEKHLLVPESSTKMKSEINSVCVKFQLLSDVLIILITSLAKWKLVQDFPDLHAHYSFDDAILMTYQNMFFEFRDSQTKLEEQIVKLFKLFNAAYCDEVSAMFDLVFSELLEVSICLPIFKEKLHNDRQMLELLQSLST